MVSGVLKSFSHPVRLRILCELTDGPKCVQELQKACGVGQVAMSQALARLRTEGRLVAERDGNRMMYSIADPRLTQLMQKMIQLYCK